MGSEGAEGYLKPRRLGLVQSEPKENTSELPKPY